MYALPRSLFDQGILRYGFHGLSYEYVMSELCTLEGKLANGRVIIAHLGSGASMAAVKEGKSIDTSMGFTPLEGLVMSTRSGDVDPGVLLYLLEHKKMAAKEINTLMNKESAAVLGGLDLLVFAGGIGERAPAVRKQICDDLDFLGVRLDAPSNEADAAVISSSQSRVRVRVISTNEDLMIARHVRSTLGWTNI